MKSNKRVLAFLLIAAMLSLVSCGKADTNQAQADRGGKTTGEGIQAAAGEEASGNPIVLKGEYPNLNYQKIERSWKKDYTEDEWKNGKCLNMYVMIPDMERQEIPVIEDELNHRL